MPFIFPFVEILQPQVTLTDLVLVEVVVLDFAIGIVCVTYVNF
jgi:hypothetical protein